MPRRVQTATLFDLAPVLPPGFVYEAGFISKDEEAALLGEIRRLSFEDVRMHGVVARRRIVQYGFNYSFDSARLSAGRTVPPFLEPLRDRAARFAGRPAADVTEALVTEYPPGAAIGWHRDAPPFEVIVGISLLSPCRFRLRRIDRTGSPVEITAEPRSVYLLSGEVRTHWQHHIPPTAALRYSITFRTLRRGPTQKSAH
ncbi:MAG: alpha-ketoglutarate-dependent dioxygenase AlkB [Bacteroidales bacterium]